MPPAARVGDATTHPGTISGPGIITVLIGGQPAAVAGDTHVCSMPPLAGPHPPTPIAGGSKSVLIGGSAAVRIGDSVGCGATITSGLPTVEIGG